MMTREDDAAFAILAVDEMRSLLPADRAQVARRKRSYLDLIRERLERLAAAGKLRDIDITTATHTLAGMVLWLPKWYRQPGRLSAGQMANEVTELAMHAVLRDSGPVSGTRAFRSDRSRGHRRHQQLPEPLIEVVVRRSPRRTTTSSRLGTTYTLRPSAPCAAYMSPGAAGASSALPDVSGPERIGRTFSHHSNP